MWLYLLFPIALLYFFLAVDLPIVKLQKQEKQAKQDLIVLDALDYLPNSIVVDSYLQQFIGNELLSLKIEPSSIEATSAIRSTLLVPWHNNLFMDSFAKTIAGYSAHYTWIVSDLNSLYQSDCESRAQSAVWQAGLKLAENLSPFLSSNVKHSYLVASEVVDADNQLEICKGIISASISDTLLSLISEILTSELNNQTLNIVLLSNFSENYVYNREQFWLNLHFAEQLLNARGVKLKFTWYFIGTSKETLFLDYYSNSFLKIVALPKEDFLIDRYLPVMEKIALEKHLWK